MGISAYREVNSTDVILRLTEDVFSNSKFEIVKDIADKAIDFLAKEYVAKNGEALLATIDVKAVANTLAIKIADEITNRILNKDTN